MKTSLITAVNNKTFHSADRNKPDIEYNNWGT